jgi:hypothetical protein
MARGLLLMTVALSAAAVAGYAVCRVTGWNVHPTEMLQAACAVAIATALAAAPLLLVGKASQVAVAQAALAGMVAHLFAAITLGALFWLPKSPDARSALLWWLMTFYFASLTALVVVLVRRVNRPSPATPAADAPGGVADGHK